MKVTNTTQPANQTFTIELTVAEIQSIAHVHAMLGVVGQSLRQDRDRLRQQVNIYPHLQTKEGSNRINEIGFSVDQVRVAAALLDRLVPVNVLTEEERGNVIAKVMGFSDL